jgi:hypothetical protein
VNHRHETIVARIQGLCWGSWSPKSGFSNLGNFGSRRWRERKAAGSSSHPSQNRDVGHPAIIRANSRVLVSLFVCLCEMAMLLIKRLL